MDRRRLIPVILAAALFFLIGASTTHAGSFGSSPPYFTADHLVPGATFSQTIYLVQDDPSVDLPIQAQLTVPDAVKGWFSIDKGFSFTIPAGVRQFPVVVTVVVPKDAGLAKYDGTLVFTTSPSQTGQVSIALGTSIAVHLTIGNDIYEKYSVPSIQFATIEEGWNPRAIVKFENDGNIPEGFDSATFDIYDQYDAVRLAYITKESGFPQIPAFTTENDTIEFPTDFHLGVGQYWGIVTFYKNQQAVASLKTVFNVVPAGSILGPFGSFIYSIERNPTLLALVVVVILFVVFIIWNFTRRRRHRHAA